MGEKWRILGLVRTHGTDPETGSYFDMAARCKICSAMIEMHNLTREEVDTVNLEVLDNGPGVKG